jgi:hypothetical protein
MKNQLFVVRVEGSGNSAVLNAVFRSEFAHFVIVEDFLVEVCLAIDQQVNCSCFRHARAVVSLKRMKLFHPMRQRRYGTGRFAWSPWCGLHFILHVKARRKKITTSRRSGNTAPMVAFQSRSAIKKRWSAVSSGRALTTELLFGRARIFQFRFVAHPPPAKRCRRRLARLNASRSRRPCLFEPSRDRLS